MSDPASFSSGKTQTYLQGNAVRVRGTFTTFSGSPVSAGSMRLLARQPGGVVQEIPLLDDGNAVYGDVVLNMPGLWTFRFEGIAPLAIATETRVMVLARSVPELV